MANLVGFERALGCANHITIGEAYLRDRESQRRSRSGSGSRSPTLEPELEPELGPEL